MVLPRRPSPAAAADDHPPSPPPPPTPYTDFPLPSPSPLDLSSNAALTTVSERTPTSESNKQTNNEKLTYNRSSDMDTLVAKHSANSSKGSPSVSNPELTANESKPCTSSARNQSTNPTSLATKSAPSSADKNESRNKDEAEGTDVFSFHAVTSKAQSSNASIVKSHTSDPAPGKVLLDADFSDNDGLVADLAPSLPVNDSLVREGASMPVSIRTSESPPTGVDVDMAMDALVPALKSSSAHSSKTDESKDQNNDKSNRKGLFQNRQPPMVVTSATEHGIFPNGKELEKLTETEMDVEKVIDGETEMETMKRNEDPRGKPSLTFDKKSSPNPSASSPSLSHQPLTRHQPHRKKQENMQDCTQNSTRTRRSAAVSAVAALRATRNAAKRPSYAPTPATFSAMSEPSSSLSRSQPVQKKVSERPTIEDKSTPTGKNSAPTPSTSKPISNQVRPSPSANAQSSPLSRATSTPAVKYPSVLTSTHMSGQTSKAVSASESTPNPASQEVLDDDSNNEPEFVTASSKGNACNNIKNSKTNNRPKTGATKELSKLSSSVTCSTKKTEVPLRRLSSRLRSRRGSTISPPRTRMASRPGSEGRSGASRIGKGSLVNAALSRSENEQAQRNVSKGKRARADSEATKSISYGNNGENESVKKRFVPVRGDEIRVLWHIDQVYYDGKIESVCSYNGKRFYDVTYSSGECEYYLDLEKRQWRFKDGRDGIAQDPPIIDDDDDEPVDWSTFPRVGDLVFVEWHVDGTFYPGVVRDIMKVQTRQFYDVDYEGGDREFFLDLLHRRWRFPDPSNPSKAEGLPASKYTAAKTVTQKSCGPRRRASASARSDVQVRKQARGSNQDDSPSSPRRLVRNSSAGKRRKRLQEMDDIVALPVSGTSSSPMRTDHRLLSSVDDGETEHINVGAKSDTDMDIDKGIDLAIDMDSSPLPHPVSVAYEGTKDVDVVRARRPEMLESLLSHRESNAASSPARPSCGSTAPACPASQTGYDSVRPKETRQLKAPGSNFRSQLLWRRSSDSVLLEEKTVPKSTGFTSSQTHLVPNQQEHHLHRRSSTLLTSKIRTNSPPGTLQLMHLACKSAPHADKSPHAPLPLSSPPPLAALSPHINLQHPRQSQGPARSTEPPILISDVVSMAGKAAQKWAREQTDELSENLFHLDKHVTFLKQLRSSYGKMLKRMRAANVPQVETDKFHVDVKPHNLQHRRSLIPSTSTTLIPSVDAHSYLSSLKGDIVSLVQKYRVDVEKREKLLKSEYISLKNELNEQNSALHESGKILKGLKINSLEALQNLEPKMLEHLRPTEMRNPLRINGEDNRDCTFVAAQQSEPGRDQNGARHQQSARDDVQDLSVSQQTDSVPVSVSFVGKKRKAEAQPTHEYKNELMSLKRKVADMTTRTEWMSTEIKRLQSREGELLIQKRSALAELMKTRADRDAVIAGKRLEQRRTSQSVPTSTNRSGPGRLPGIVKKRVQQQRPSDQGATARSSGRANRKSTQPGQCKPTPANSTSAVVILSSNDDQDEIGPVEPTAPPLQPSAPASQSPSQLGQSQLSNLSTAVLSSTVEQEEAKPIHIAMTRSQPTIGSQQPTADASMAQPRTKASPHAQVTPTTGSTPLTPPHTIAPTPSSTSTTLGVVQSMRESPQEQLWRQMDKQASELLGMISCVWLLQDETRSEPPKEGGWLQEQWVRKCVLNCLTHAAWYLEGTRGVMSAKRALRADVDGESINTDWVIENVGDDVLEAVRTNYNLWEPELEDSEWAAEKLVISGLGNCLVKALSSTPAKSYSATIAYAKAIAQRAINEFETYLPPRYTQPVTQPPQPLLQPPSQPPPLPMPPSSTTTASASASASASAKPSALLASVAPVALSSASNSTPSVALLQESMSIPITVAPPSASSSSVTLPTVTRPTLVPVSPVVSTTRTTPAVQPKPVIQTIETTSPTHIRLSPIVPSLAPKGLTSTPSVLSPACVPSLPTLSIPVTDMPKAKTAPIINSVSTTASGTATTAPSVITPTASSSPVPTKTAFENVTMNPSSTAFKQKQHPQSEFQNQNQLQHQNHKQMAPSSAARLPRNPVSMATSGKEVVPAASSTTTELTAYPTTFAMQASRTPVNKLQTLSKLETKTIRKPVTNKTTSSPNNNQAQLSAVVPVIESAPNLVVKRAVATDPVKPPSASTSAAKSTPPLGQVQTKMVEIAQSAPASAPVKTHAVSQTKNNAAVESNKINVVVKEPTGKDDTNKSPAPKQVGPDSLQQKQVLVPMKVASATTNAPPSLPAPSTPQNNFQPQMNLPLPRLQLSNHAASGASVAPSSQSLTTKAKLSTTTVESSGEDTQPLQQQSQVKIKNKTQNCTKDESREAAMMVTVEEELLDSSEGGAGGLTAGMPRKYKYRVPIEQGSEPAGNSGEQKQL